MSKNSGPTEKPAGDAIHCLGGVVHVYHSGEGDLWARLCMVVAAPSGRARADVLLSPEQADSVASAMEKGSDFSCAASLGMLWYRRAASTLRAECAFGNGGKEVCVTDMHLHQIAAALRAASSPMPGGGAAVRSRTDDNLRRVFG